MPDDLKRKAEVELASRKGTDRFVMYEFKDYEGDALSSFIPSAIAHLPMLAGVVGTTHGFAIRPDLRYPNVVDAQKKSVDQITAWFDKTLAV